MGARLTSALAVGLLMLSALAGSVGCGYQATADDFAGWWWETNSAAVIPHSMVIKKAENGTMEVMGPRVVSEFTLKDGELSAPSIVSGKTDVITYDKGSDTLTYTGGPQQTSYTFARVTPEKLKSTLAPSSTATSTP